MSTSTKLSLQEVKHVAKLASLPLGESEAAQYSDDLGSVLELISDINQLDTETVAETNQVTGLTNIFREDKIDRDRILSQEQALAGAKRTHNGYFVVGALISQ